MPEDKSKRRTNAVSGFVNFPVNYPNLPSDKQGGMFVRLVVIDVNGEKNWDERWPCCCGGYQNYIMDETYVRDDIAELNRRKIHTTENSTTENLIGNHADDDSINENYHFPWIDSDEEIEHKFESRPYLCIMTIGSTGWSNVFWACTYDDLTEKGKSLYKLLSELYSGCEIRLITFLDT